MLRMNLNKPKVECQPVGLSTLKEDAIVVDKQTGEKVIVVAVLRSKVTYRTYSGQYSCLPEDFVKRFGILAEPTYAECKQNLSRALNVSDDVADGILRTGKMP